MAKDSPELEKILSDLDSMGKELDNLQNQISKHMANRVEVLRKMADLVSSEKSGSAKRTKKARESTKKKSAAKKSIKKTGKKTVKKTIAKKSAKITTRRRKKASIKRKSNK